MIIFLKKYSPLLTMGVLFLLLFFSCHDDGDDSSNSDNDPTPEPPAGTWIDYNTNLMWEKEIAENSSILYYQWEKAIGYCDSLELAGFSDWRLPTISELRSLVRGCEATMTGGACGVTDECTVTDCQNEACVGCDLLTDADNEFFWPKELERESSTGNEYWSFTELEDHKAMVWTLGFMIANIEKRDKENILDSATTTRCVRTMAAE
ncbi:MAG: DUF1566 domain-containing protein [Myxococcales bacterium]|nr:DUF1566 domain-containing protein [Myxococcales bacterium]